MNNRKTAAETAYHGIAMDAVRALCEFSLLVRQQNHSDLSLTALDNALKQLYKKKGAFQEKKMYNHAMAKVNEQWESESHQLQVKKIHKIHTVMEVQVYGAEKVTTT